MQVVDPPTTRVSRRTAYLLTAFFAGVVIVAIASLISLPYVVMRPGPATDILSADDGKPIISITGAKTYPTSGKLDFTTVRLSGGPGASVNIVDILVGWVSPSEDVYPRSDFFPDDISEQQVEEEGAQQMAESQTVAAAVALRAIGRTVTETLTVSGIPKGSPATGRFEVGDVLKAVEGAAIRDAAALHASIGKHRAGDTISVLVLRKGVEKTVRTTLGAVDGQPRVGIGFAVGYDLPAQVTVDTGKVSGPSAGLMFTVAMYDLLTPGELTGGASIAGTGTISDDGTVGPIGGIRQKLAGASAAGSTWFLAPAANCDEVVGAVPEGLRVVRIATFDDARAAVEKIGRGSGADLPGCSRS